MTIYWQPDSEPNPDSIDVWHVAEDGTVNGPLTVDMSDIDGMPDPIGGLCPKRARQEVTGWARNRGISDGLAQEVIWDQLELDYVRGAPP